MAAVFLSKLRSLVPDCWSTDFRATLEAFPSAFLIDEWPSSQDLRDKISQRLHPSFPFEEADAPASFIEYVSALDCSQPEKVVPFYHFFMKECSLVPESVPRRSWSARRAFLIVSALSELVDLPEVFRTCPFWQSIKDQDPEKSNDPGKAGPGPAKKLKATIQEDPEDEGLAQVADGLFEEEFALLKEMQTQGGGHKASKSLHKEPREALDSQPAVSSSSAARLEGIAAVRQASAGSSMFNMNAATRWEDWFSMEPGKLDEWERGMEKHFLGFAGAELKLNAGAAAETRSLIQSIRLLLNQQVPMEVRCQAFAFHSFIRLSGNKMRMKARALPSPSSRDAALEAADRWVKKALGSVVVHPMEKEISDEVSKEAGNLVLAAGMQALKGGFSPGAAPSAQSAGRFGGQGRGQGGSWGFGQDRRPAWGGRARGGRRGGHQQVFGQGGRRDGCF